MVFMAILPGVSGTIFLRTVVKSMGKSNLKADGDGIRQGLGLLFQAPAYFPFEPFSCACYNPLSKCDKIAGVTAVRPGLHPATSHPVHYLRKDVLFGPQP
jgi:hypothetical protein